MKTQFNTGLTRKQRARKVALTYFLSQMSRDNYDGYNRADYYAYRDELAALILREAAHH